MKRANRFIAVPWFIGMYGLIARHGLIAAHWRAIGLLSAPLWAFTSSWVEAGPTGEHIVGGNGSIVRPNDRLTEIHQQSDRLAIDWQQFNVNANEVVRFVQPSSRSMALNRIFDSKSSLILGRIEANGRIFLINPRGIIFGKDATINVAGLIASSLDIDPDHFIKGNFTFTDQGGDGVIVNRGTIEAAVGGAVVLLGKVVINEGNIRAPQGSVQLTSASGTVISFDDNEQLGIQITAEQQQKIAEQNDAVRNSGTISVEGGYIALNGATTADLFTTAVNNEGVLVANSVRNHNGVIELVGSNGNVAQSGVIDVSAKNDSESDGGRILINANNIQHSGQLIADGANGGAILLKTNGQLHANDLILTKDNSTISAIGNDGVGGRIELLADRVGVMNQSRIDASGNHGGGIVYVGGAFHGERQENSPRNAQRTVVDNGVSIYADAKTNGNGGEVVLWSDDITYFGGKISARGGANSGDGGNVEVSGKQSLDFRGFVDTSAPHGNMGNLLLDPAIINIIDGSGGAQDAGVADGIILSGDSPSPYQISEQALEALTSNVTLTATQQINIANLSDNVLLFNPSGGTVTFNVNGTNGASSFTMADTNDEIRVNNGSLAINVVNSVSGVGASTAGAATLTLGNLTTTSGSVSVQGSVSANSSTTGATTGNVIISMGAVSAGTGVTVNGATSAISTPSTANAGAVTVTTGNITAGGNVSLTGTTTGDNNSGSSATAGNVSVTSGTINTSGTVSASTSSNTSPAAAGTATSGSAATTVGDIVAGGAVTLSSSSTASNGLGTQNGKSTTVTASDISITGNAPLQITTTSSGTGNALRQVNLGGNYIANGGNETVTTYTLDLTSNAVFNTTGTISLNYTNLVTNGFTLTQGAITNIYVGDISGSAGAGELGFSQSDINAFAGSGLVLSATNTIFLGNATINSPSATSVQLIADSDTSGAGDISIASGKTFDLNGRNLIASGANATINGTILNTGSGTEQIITTGGITLGSGATMVSGSGNISLNAGTSLAMASDATIASGSGQLSLTAANTIALGSLSTANATTSAVSVTSTSGAITNAGATTNIFAIAAGSRANLHAASGITSSLSINDLALTNSTSGAISLTNDRALQISSLANTPATAASITTTGGGSNMTIAGNVASGSNLSLTSSGTFTVNNGNTVNSNAGTLSINSTGDAAITGLTTTNNTSSTVSVISGGAITDNGNTNLDITATQTNAVVTLQAANGIGATNALDTSIANLALTNSTSGAVNLTNNRALQINSLTNTPATAVSITTTGGTSDLTVAGTTTSGAALSLISGRNMSIVGNVSSAGNLALTSSGTFGVTDGFTVDSNAGTLSINSTGDAAITGLTTTNNNASAISIISGGAITDNGNTNADIAATGASAVATLQAANGIGAANALDTAIANLALTNSASGAVNVTNNRALQINSITNTPATALSITTTGVGSNMTVAGNVASGSNIALTSSGTFAVNDGITVNSNAGTLAINSTGNAAITGLTTTNNTASAVSVFSVGAISDNGDTNADITATQPGAVATLQATSGIGNANPIDINATTIAASNGNSGDIRLHALSSHTFSAIDNSASAGGTVALSADSNLAVNSVTTANGAIVLSAFDNVTLNSGTTLQSAGGNIAITADSNTNGVGAIAMNNGVIAAGSGTIALNAAQNIALNQLTTTNATTSAVSITSTAGKILGNFDGTADITATTAGSRVTLNAATGIDAGGSNPLELSINDSVVANSTSGGINLTNNRSLQVSSFANNANGNSTITVTGAGNNLIFAGTLQNNGSNATLAATQNISLQNMANVAALNTSSTTVNYAQTISAGSITSTGTATVAGNLTASSANIDLQTVALGAGSHTFTTGVGDINLGTVTGSSDLQLNSSRDITLTSAALGAGNFSASSATNGVFTANGNISAGSVTLNQFSMMNLRRLSASNTLSAGANIINLFDDVDSVGAMTLTGTTQLQNDILLSITGSANLLQLNGNIVGNNHALTTAAANNTVCIACTSGVSATDFSAFAIQSSVKSVLGMITVNGNATINADQEIYLNDDTTITGNLLLLADANNDNIGIAAQLAGKQLNVGGVLTTQPIALQTISTAEQCAIPTGLPQMPGVTNPPVIPPPINPALPPPLQEELPAELISDNIKVALQENSKYDHAVSDAALHNVSQITYLNSGCESHSSSQKNNNCNVDASMLNFLGTFLIDNQIPKTGNAQ